jgi:hypothetical protein
MALLNQLVDGPLTEEQIEKKKRNIQAVISDNADIEKAIDSMVGAERPNNKEALEKARIKAIKTAMRNNFHFAKAIGDAAHKP